MKPTGAVTLAAVLLLFLATILIPSTKARSNPGGGGGFGVPGFSDPGFGNGFPAKGNGWAGGYGGGYSGPHGGRSWSGTRRPTTVCTEKGPCHKKKLTCPAKCFKAWGKSGKHYGGGGGGGGCTMDCKKKCVAYC